MTVTDYAADHSSPEEPLLKELVRRTHLHVMHPRMLSGHIQGKLLEQIACMMQPKRILEIGTFTGYSTLCLAKGLPEDGRLHTIECNDELHEIAHTFIKQSEHADKIIMHTGDALHLLPALEEVFDLVYIDGNKREYIDYYRSVFDKVRPGGFILADNVLWDGKVIETPAPADAQTKGIVAFNERIKKDHRVEKVLLPLRDGIYIIRKL